MNGYCEYTYKKFTFLNKVCVVMTLNVISRVIDYIYKVIVI